VEWSFVDYGGENFYVASYRRPEEEVVEPASEVQAPVEESGCRWSNCIPIFRCWATNRPDRRAAWLAA